MTGARRNWFERRRLKMRRQTKTDEKDEKNRKRPREKGTGTIFKPKGSSFWWIAYMSGGKRRYESTKSVLKGAAVNLLMSRLGDNQRGIVVTPKIGKITCGVGLTAVVSDLKINGR